MIDLAAGAQATQRRTDDTMEQFRADRFGQFIHWGLYSIPSGRWRGRFYDFAAEFLPKSAGIDDAEWQELASDFAVERFDADEWARTAEALGVRYLTITTKHHEGFCLWPSGTTDFTVEHAAVGRDLLGEIVDAYTRAGIAVHFYYSVLDWHHPDWRYRLESEEDEMAFERYLGYAKAQLRELAENYPDVRGFWFDGTWDESVKRNGAWTLEIERMLKELIPGAVVNSRLRADDFGARHIDSNGHLMGDFESGYERRLPLPWDREVIGRDWEACMTITQGSWGHHRSPRVTETRKGPNEIIELLAHTVSRSGNLLVNFGPDGDGCFADYEQDIVDRVGAWLRQYGEAIYGCGHAEGWDYPGWGFYTQSRRSDMVYAVVTRIPVSGSLLVELPSGVRLREVIDVASGDPLEFQEREPSIVAVPLQEVTSGERSRRHPFALAMRTTSRDGSERAEQFTDPNPDAG